MVVKYLSYGLIAGVLGLIAAILTIFFVVVIDYFVPQHRIELA